MGRKSRNGIIPAPAQGLAPQQSPQGQPDATEGAMLLDGEEGVLGAARRKAAMGLHEGRDAPLIAADSSQKNPTHKAHLPPSGACVSRRGSHET